MDDIKQLIEHRTKELGGELTREELETWFFEVLDEGEELYLL